jgi:C-terminal processing protease CtpA/Prc
MPNRSAILRIGVVLGLVLFSCASAAPGTIGAALGKRTDGRLFIRSIPPGQGAANAGLAVDDEILLIDGREVRTMSEEDIRRAVRGDVGSTMVLTIERGGTRREIKLQRSPLLAEKTEKPK